MSPPPTLLVLCAIDPDEPMRRCRGQSRFLGEVGLRLDARGIRMLCAEPADPVGHRPVRGGWIEEPVEGVVAVLDRHRVAHPAELARWGESGAEVANPPGFRALCDDKLAFARWARGRGLPVPATRPGDDPGPLVGSHAFVKPRTGWGGSDVRQHAGGPLGAHEIVQQSVKPVRAGEAIRLLLQRDVAERWIVAGALARLAPSGQPVASLARGARAAPLEVSRLESLAPLVGKLAEALEDAPGGDRAIEVGVDLILAQDRAWILEWNARPGRSFDRVGREDQRAEAQMRPFALLLRRAGISYPGSG